MTRRELLQAATLATASVSMPALALAGYPTVVIFDSRYALSRRWAQRQPDALRRDARDDILRIWRRFAAVTPHLRMSGLTTWADFQVVCGCAAESRLQVWHRRLEGSVPSAPALVVWSVVQAA